MPKDVLITIILFAGTVSVLPEWWSAATQTAYDPAAVHQRRMSRHRRWALVVLVMVNAWIRV